MTTTVGEIDIELWSKECPKACRNFVQLCLEGYYNGLTFHRVVKGFIVQGGCPNGDGTGKDSIYGEAFKDEFHSRLRYSRRRMLGMANSDKDDNGSQFFFSMAATPELQQKNTLFGKVTGNTIFNMLKLEECLVDHNERPLHPIKIIKTEVLNNPFDDIVTRRRQIAKAPKNDKKSVKVVKNFNLLSFGHEAEDDEVHAKKFEKQKCFKGKSSHDALNDPNLSKESIKTAKLTENVNISVTDIDLEKIKEKLNTKADKIKNIQNNSESSEDEDSLRTIEQEKQLHMEKQKYF